MHPLMLALDEAGSTASSWAVPCILGFILFVAIVAAVVEWHLEGYRDPEE